jgi:DME family drug/metabolite transporter
MALISGALGYFLFSLGQKSIEASEATVFSYIKPIFAVPLAVIWLGEKITVPFIIGSIIITLGVAVAEIKKSHLASPQG